MDVRIGAYGVIVRDDAILLSHWNSPAGSGWSLPGGGVEDFELIPDAAIREIREETGYDARLDRLLGIDSFFVAGEDRQDGSGRPLHGLRVIYAASITGGTLTSEVAGSSDEARWVGLTEVPDLDTVELVQIALALWRESV